MNTLVWFRNDLRVEDNNSLWQACQQKGTVLAVYFFDPRHYALSEFGFKKTECYRAQFLIETVTDLQQQLAQRNITLLTFLGKPEDHLSELVEKHDIEAIYLQKEWTRDEQQVLKAAQNSVGTKVTFHETYDQFLFHPTDIPYASFDEIPEVFTTFRKRCEKLAKIHPPKAAPNPRPEAHRIANPTQLPKLSDLGLDHFTKDARTAFPFKGGATAGRERIQHYFWDTQKLAHYKKTRNGLIGQDYSSKLSAWLANGSLSPRTIYAEVKRFEKTITKNQDTYWLVFELIWRDYFKYVSLKHGPSIFALGGILNRSYHWGTDARHTQVWINGATQEPFVNANMIELQKTGWMSNRGRQNVASFWAKELQQDWRIGAAYFESMLIDYDVHSNWGNWMYNSGVGNDPRDRKFNIKGQAERYDPKGHFQKQWLQEVLF
ncbi:MAG: DASH family cryptochrome [Bacteroidota bacterium]